MTVFSAADHEAMARALRLAERGLWTTSPNPRVGCVLMRDGLVVGEGWHARAGEPHAEVHALRVAGARARGATAYVTLEPCSHFGRTPPCAQALLDAGVVRVVAAMEDPNPLVAGQGLAALRAGGIQVDAGLLADAARELNLGFVSRMTRGRPWVRVKLAASLDGRTALAGGESQWITGAEARRDGHRFRARACAILSGIGTVELDDPQLSVREVDTERQPWRVVVDGGLRLSPQARVLHGGGTLVVCGAAADTVPAAHRNALLAAGAEILRLPGDGGHVDLPALLHELARRGCNELHVEAGGRLAGALLARGLVDELLLYLAPCLIGDTGRGLFAIPELASLADRPQLAIRDLRLVGSDLRLLARLN
jgi:diaminohydroxyphosphoribosylaminopyrimidine deaminase/5-amino-6-(5-phosphoribosylamino)uracil reductase